MESSKDQCRKLGCPGCRSCLDMRKKDNRKIVLENEVRHLEFKEDSLKEELKEIKAKLLKKKVELNEVK